MCFIQLNLQCSGKLICSLLLLIQDIFKFEFTQIWHLSIHDKQRCSLFCKMLLNSSENHGN